MIGLPLNAYAQTSDLVPLEDKKHYAQFSIDNVRVEEKDYYKVIFMDVHIKVKDLALEDSTEINGKVTLTNENGKTYQPNPPDCQLPCLFPLTLITGAEGGIGKISVQYMVEKEFNKFKVYYNIPYYDMQNPSNNPYPSFQIGSIDLTNVNGQVPTPSSSPSDTNPSSNLSTSNISQSTNIFEQLMNWLKQIFHFMILGSFLHDS